MMNPSETPALPARLAAIVEDFALCEGREKLELLLQFSEQLPPLPAPLQAHRDRMDPVPECMSPVFAFAEVQAGQFRFFLDAPAEAPTVRGFAAILSLGLAEASPQQILDVPPLFYDQMGLASVLSGQRLNGIRAILARVKHYARQALAGELGGALT